MAAKIAFLIVAIGLCAVALLGIRQLRTQAAHELTEARLRIMNRDNELWRVRTAIAEGVSPRRVQQMAASLNAMQPITPELAAKPEPEPSKVAGGTTTDQPTEPQP